MLGSARAGAAARILRGYARDDRPTQGFMPLLGVHRAVQKSQQSRFLISSPCARTCTCAQVVPDVAPGFNVPNFYDDFIRERRAFVQEKIENRRQQISAQTMPPHPRPLNTSVPIG